MGRKSRPDLRNSRAARRRSSHGALAAYGNHSPVDAFKGANVRQRIDMPFKPSGEAAHPADRAMSRDTSWAVGPPDILLIFLASLSLWALIVWAISRYL